MVLDGGRSHTEVYAFHAATCLFSLSIWFLSTLLSRSSSEEGLRLRQPLGLLSISAQITCAAKPYKPLQPPTSKISGVVFPAHRSRIKSRNGIKGYMLPRFKTTTVVKHYGVLEVTVMALVCSLYIWWSSRKLTYFPVWKQQLKILTLLLGFFCFVSFFFF